MERERVEFKRPLCRRVRPAVSAYIQVDGENKNIIYVDQYCLYNNIYYNIFKCCVCKSFPSDPNFMIVQ